MKTDKLSIVAIGSILIAAIMVGYIVARPAIFVEKKSAPIFMGEELTVKRGVEGIRGQQRAIEVKKAVRVEKAVRAERAVKAESIPMVQPKVLPIIPPMISYRVLPEYPMSALEKGLTGTTILSIYVGMAGSPDKVEVKASSGVAELDQSAITAVSQWKFSPAAQGGQALASWFEVPVRFELN
ncbi:MAG: energy transducer TonB [Candidatus Margulisbacteria bacterium]|nr:energy transducer TonB [Candidatus Margulisiibacteriota bacterium]